jgi:hypothetical protein
MGEARSLERFDLRCGWSRSALFLRNIGHPADVRPAECPTETPPEQERTRRHDGSQWLRSRPALIGREDWRRPTRGKSAPSQQRRRLRDAGRRQPGLARTGRSHRSRSGFSSINHRSGTRRSYPAQRLRRLFRARYRSELIHGCGPDLVPVICFDAENVCWVSRIALVQRQVA